MSKNRFFTDSRNRAVEAKENFFSWLARLLSSDKDVRLQPIALDCQKKAYSRPSHQRYNRVDARKYGDGY